MKNDKCTVNNDFLLHSFQNQWQTLGTSGEALIHLYPRHVAMWVWFPPTFIPPPHQKTKFPKWSQILCEYTHISYLTERFNIFLKKLFLLTILTYFCITLYLVFFCICVNIFGLCRQLPLQKQFCPAKFYILAACLLYPRIVTTAFIVQNKEQVHAHNSLKTH